jgi:diguanylate cyclase (GGDEF)-like protein/PAS domain S-box-containing protein
VRLYELLAAASTAVLHADSVDDVLAGVCDVAVEPGRFTLAWVGIVTDGALRPVVARGPATDYLRGVELDPRGRGPASRALHTGTTVVVPDIGLEPNFRYVPEAREHALASMCVVPLRQGSETIGVLAVYSPAPDDFDELAVRVLEALMADVVFALGALAHREAEAAAREESRRLDAQRAALLRHNRDVVAILEPDGHVHWISEGVERLTGYPPEFYVGSIALGVHPEDVEKVVRDWGGTMAEPESEAVTVMRLAHRDGGWRWCEVRTSNQLQDPLIEGFLVNFHDITEEKEATDAARFRAEVLASVGDAVVASDIAGHITYMNAAGLMLGDWELDDVVGQSVLELLPFDGLADVLPELRAALQARVPWSGELTYHLPGGRSLPMLVTNTPIVRDGEVVGMIGVAADISARVEAEERLEARARMQAEVARLGQLALRSVGTGAVAAGVVEVVGTVLGLDAVMLVEVVDEHRVMVRASWGDRPPQAESPLAGEGRLELASLGLRAGHPVLIDDFTADPRFRAGPEQVVTHRAGAIVAVAGSSAFHGSLVALSHEPRTFDPDEVSFMEALANVIAAGLDRERAEQELLHLGLSDSLTGLPNRVLLLDRVAQALARSVGPGRMVGVLIVDLDRFKELNDAYGHEAGDRLLVEVTRRLQSAIGPDDTLARMGGDEFAVLCPSLTSIDDVTDRATALAAALEPAVRLDDVELFVTASTGIAVRDQPGAAADTLLREADAAMYRAKEAGRSRHELYDERMRQQAIRRLDTSTALRRALERDELRVVWQPEVALGLAHAASTDLWAEALVRWEHPERGLLAPGEFIALAEETGLIVPLGEFVIDAAFRQLAEWHRIGGPAPTQISVNLSPRQLGQDSLVPTLRAAVAEHGVDPADIILEITETAVMTDPERAIARLEELRDLGFRLAVDDFGTGYSSLGYLRKLPVSVLKIDRVFVSGLTTHRHDWSIVKGTIELAHALGLTVVAEGVETDEQRHQLVGLGCDRGQGFLWSRPVPAGELLVVAEALGSP